MKKYKHAKEKKPTERAGFYIALSVCMMAVAMAVWSAYTTFTEPEAENEGYFSSLSGGQAVAQPMTGVTEAHTQAQTEPATEAPTVAPTEPVTEAERGFILSETQPQTESVDKSSELTALQAVLRVTDSLVYPVKSQTVTKPYSEDSVYNQTMHDYRAHTGCDFAAETGENVYAMCGGTVSHISVSELYGVIVELDCGDFSVYYCGLDSNFAVAEGDELSAGDTVGTVGHIPSESGDKPHVHIEVRVGDRLIDPLSVIDSDS